jgi:hypothetical protein
VCSQLQIPGSEEELQRQLAAPGGKRALQVGGWACRGEGGGAACRWG